MDENDRLFAAIEKLQESVADVKADIGVLSNQYREADKKFDRVSAIMDGYAIRLRQVETKLEKHVGYFAILGASLLACVGSIFNLFTR